MENVTIISHLTPKEWKMSWEDKVVEDTKEKMRAYQYPTVFGDISKMTMNLPSVIIKTARLNL